MPAVAIEKPTAASPATAWAFVAEMDHWAPLLTGYQRHEKIDATRSRWLVKGEIGGLSRTAEFEVTITQWVEPEHIAFTLEGLDEPFSGSGAFRVAGASAIAAGAPTSVGWWARLRVRLARWLLGRVTSLSNAERPSGAAEAPSEPRSVLSCRLEIQAGGGSGPIMNLLLGPLLGAVAEDTATRIVQVLEEGASSTQR